MLGHVIHRFVQGDAQHTGGQDSGDKFSCDTHRPSQGRTLPQEALSRAGRCPAYMCGRVLDHTGMRPQVLSCF